MLVRGIFAIRIVIVIIQVKARLITAHTKCGLEKNSWKYMGWRKA